MNFHGITMIGKFKIQEVSVLPTPYDTDLDRKRIILVTNDGLYFGGDTEWVRIMDESTAVLLAENIVGYDSAGNSYYYGTNASGNVGFFALPSAPANLARLISESDDPGTSDDVSAGHTVGTIWFNTTDKRFFLSFDETINTAIWNKISTSVDLKKSFVL